MLSLGVVSAGDPPWEDLGSHKDWGALVALNEQDQRPWEHAIVASHACFRMSQWTLTEVRPHNCSVSRQSNTTLATEYFAPGGLARIFQRDTMLCIVNFAYNLIKSGSPFWSLAPSKATSRKDSKRQHDMPVLGSLCRGCAHRIP